MKCLRCGAGREWIEETPPKPKKKTGRTGPFDMTAYEPKKKRAARRIPRGAKP